MKILSIVKVYFERRRPDIDQAWLEARFEFFRDYTLRSLKAQHHQDFVVWACCGPNMQRMIDPLLDILVAADVPVVFTFTNPCFMAGGAERTPVNSLRFCAPGALDFYDYVYVTRVDSDDLLAPSALDHVRAVTPLRPDRVEASIFQTGYMHELGTDKLGVYSNPSSPFHTLMFPRQMFTSPDVYFANFVGDHSKVRAAYHCHVLPEFKFCVLIHGRNFLSTFDYSRLPDRPPRRSISQGWTVDRFIAGEC